MNKGKLRNYLPVGSAHLLALVVVVLLISSIVSLAANGQGRGSDDGVRVIKEATKLSRSGSYTDAEKLLRNALAANTGRTDLTVELAYVLAKERRIREAYDLAVPVAQAEPRNSRAFSVLGYIFLAAGRFADARLVLQNAMTLNRRDDLAWWGAGMLDFYENRISASVFNLREAVNRQPDDPDYWFALAQVSARNELYKDAADAYDHFLNVSKAGDKDRRQRIAGLVTFLRFLGDRERLYWTSGANQSAVGFELVGNRPIIKLRVNGRSQPMKFVLDTGSGITVISDETARMLKVKPITRGGFARGLGGDGKFEIVYGFLRQVGIGEINVHSVPVYIRKFHGSQSDIDGYIGLSLISKFLTTIDYGSQTFSLTKRDSDKRDFREGTALTLPLRLTTSGFLSGEVQLEGVETPLNFIVDTGASVSVISDGVANMTEMKPFANKEKLTVIGSAGITDDVPTFLLPKVTFGNQSRTKVSAIALNLDVINEASGFEQAGILGGNFLKNYKLTFDFKNSKVEFTPVKPEN